MKVKGLEILPLARVVIEWEGVGAMELWGGWAIEGVNETVGVVVEEDEVAGVATGMESAGVTTKAGTSLEGGEVKFFWATGEWSENSSSKSYDGGY